MSYVTPIHKNGNASNIKHYRRIAIISAIPKLFENLVTDFLTCVLIPHIIEEQFGFHKKKSTELNHL